MIKLLQKHWIELIHHYRIDKYRSSAYVQHSTLVLFPVIQSWLLHGNLQGVYMIF
jgi:hypothetical protein